MNQILNINLETTNNNLKKIKKKNWFKFQFSFSIITTSILILYVFYYFLNLSKQEYFSKDLMSNYNVYQLYASTSNRPSQDNSNGVFGIVEIPKINLYYPVFSVLTESLLKISPCKFYGDSPTKYGNLCIAGHNYNNSLFFSKISTLNLNDEIHIYDNFNTKYTYFVCDIYEVDPSDTSPVLNYDKTEKTLTLVTCNNLNSNRIIVKAKQK